MNLESFEAIVENGLVRLPAGHNLPDKTRVYVLVAKDSSRPYASIPSVHHVRPEDAARFQMEVVREPGDAQV